MQILMKAMGKRQITLEEGMVFQYEDGERYMLAQLDEEKYVLVSLVDGNRWDSIGSMQEVLEQLLEEEKFTYTGKYVSDLLVPDEQVVGEDYETLLEENRMLELENSLLEQQVFELECELNGDDD